MSLPNVKSGMPGIVLGVISAAFMLNAITAHSQGNGEPPSSGSSQQSQKSEGASSSSAMSSGAEKFSRADEKLVNQLAEANLAEINAGKLAEQKSKNDEVKSFAKKMVDDHTKALDELKELAEAKGVTLPTEPDRQQKAMEKRLSSLSGDKFDKQYMQQAGDRAHKDTRQLLQQVSTKAQDTELKNYASKTLAVVKDHEQMAKDTTKNLSSTSQGKSGAGTSGGGSEEKYPTETNQ